MHNSRLAADYIHRAAIRLEAVDLLYRAESWADVVRESQEIVELALKALLRAVGVAPPRIHDVSEILLAERSRLPEELSTSDVERLAAISRELRRDRELAFNGAEDLTPGDFYRVDDATRARDGAAATVEVVRRLLPAKGNDR